MCDLSDRWLFIDFLMYLLTAVDLCLNPTRLALCSRHRAVLKSIRNHKLAEWHLELFFDADETDAVVLAGTRLRRETAYARAETSKGNN